ncbi:MAG: cytochrome c3 family protein [Desulforhopalus sp.]
MLKKVFVCSVVSMFVIGGAVITSLATSDPGPAEITIESSKSAKPKPAVFPHKKHQDAFECGECHHGMVDGKQVPYTEGQEIQKCEECHNADVLAGKKKDKLKLDTIKGAGHGNCLVCHKEMAKNDPALKERKIDKCSACHPKK